MRWIVLTAAIGAAGCSAPVSTSGLCGGLKRPVADLRGALVANIEETPDPVGEAATDVVVASEAGCRWEPSR